MLKDVERFCLKHGLFQKGDRILIACSGGPDSLALTEIMLALKEKYSLCLLLAHFEHGIRGRESEEDALFVEKYADERNLPFVSEHFDVPAYAKERGLSLETAAREARYDFLRRAAEDWGANAIATAHHADDQAETVLMHLLRGTGVHGLSGMRPVQNSIIRPLLAVKKNALIAFCHDKKLSPRQDATNESLDHMRNRIRLSLMPELRLYNPRMTEALVNLADILRQQEDFLQLEGEKNLPLALTPDGHALSLKFLRNLSPALAMELLRIYALKEVGNITNWSHKHYEALWELIQKGAGKTLYLPNRTAAHITKGKFVLKRW